MTSLRPWREIAVPHRDVLEGTFQQSEFAADITAVHTGKATVEYGDAIQFLTARSSPKACGSCSRRWPCGSWAKVATPSSSCKRLFPAKPRQEMEDRKRRFDDGDVVEKIHEVLKKTVGSRGGMFNGVHVFTPHGDVPDDSGLRLVVLPPTQWYSRDEPRQAATAVLSRLRDTARVVLAWQSIVDDVETGRLNIDVLQQNQAKKELQTASDVLSRAARECYKWLLCPVQ